MFRSTCDVRRGALGVASVITLFLAGSDAQGNLLAYDPFLYGVDPSQGQYLLGNEDSGTNVIGGQNPVIGPTAFYSGPWVQSGGDSQVVKAMPSFSYPGMPAGLGGIQQETTQFACCSFGRTGRPITGGLGGGPARTLYQSFLIDFGTQGGDDPTQFGFRGHELWDGGVGDSFKAVSLFVNHFSGIDELSLEVTTNSGSAVLPVSGGGLTLDAMEGVHLVVMKYEFNPIAADRVSVYFDPTLGAGEPGVASASVSVGSSDLFITHQGAFTQFTFSGADHVNGGIDEIRWGTTYNSVVPEPGALSLLPLAIAPLARRRR